MQTKTKTSKHILLPVVLNFVVALMLAPPVSVAKTVSLCAPEGKPLRLLVNGSLPRVK